MNITNLVLKLLENQEFTSKLLSFGNQTLKLIVPENLQQLEDYQALAGKKINFLLADSNLGITLVVNQGLELTLVSPDQPVDLEITLKKSALNKLLAKESDFEELIKTEEVVLEGNNQLLLHLANLSVRIDYSLENILSKYLGDEVAYFMSKGADKVFQVGKDLLGFINGMGNSNSEVYQTNEDYFRDDSLEAQEERKRIQLGLANQPSKEAPKAQPVTKANSLETAETAVTAEITESAESVKSTATNTKALSQANPETNSEANSETKKNNGSEAEVKADSEASFEAKIEKTVESAFESTFGKDFEQRFEKSFENVFESTFEKVVEGTSKTTTQADQDQVNQTTANQSAQGKNSDSNQNQTPKVNPEVIAQEVFKAMTPVIEGVLDVFSSLKKK